MRWIAGYRVFVPVKVGPTSTGTKRGREILLTAERWNLDPHELASALGEVEGRQSEADFRHAIAAARKKPDSQSIESNGGRTVDEIIPRILDWT